MANNSKPPKYDLQKIFKLAAYTVAGALVLNIIFGQPKEDIDQSPSMRDSFSQQGYGRQSLTQSSNFGTIPYSSFLEFLDRGDIKRVQVQKENTGQTVVRGTTRNGSSFSSNVIDDPWLVDRLQKAGVEFSAPKIEEPSPFGRMLFSLLPAILIVGAMLYMMRAQAGAARGGLGSFAGNKAKLLTKNDIKVTFDDVEGVQEAKEDLVEIVDFLKNPKKYERLGGKIPKGVLLVGPPGTGKTLIARAVAGEAGVPFFSISGSDFVEMFVGVGASRVRKMFEEGRNHAPCIIFIDEIDAIGRRRSSGMGNNNDEREQTLNQILVEMDGFNTSSGLILIAATNRPEILDPALKRPGRFDREVVVGLPDINGRERILGVHTRNVPLDPDVELHVLARGTPGFSGADLANLVNEAALSAARNNRSAVTMHDFESAKDKIMMGAERKSMVMSDADKACTAYHEAGHALTVLHQKHSDPIHKATIIPRGRALGMVMRLPEKDAVSMSLAQIKANLVVAYGGREAELLKFGAESVTTGASGDIQYATNLARRMVTEWGMSEKLGRVRYVDDQQGAFLGGMGGMKNVSEDTARLIDAEVKRLTDEAEAEARRILTQHSDQLETIAQALLEYETLSGAEIKGVLRGEKPVRTPPTPANDSVKDSGTQDETPPQAGPTPGPV